MHDRMEYQERLNQTLNEDRVIIAPDQMGGFVQNDLIQFESVQFLDEGARYQHGRPMRSNGDRTADVVRYRNSDRPGYNARLAKHFAKPELQI